MLVTYDNFTQERMPFGDEEVIEITAIAVAP